MEFIPRIFLGSSKEALATAKIIQNTLNDVAECKLWPDVFDFGKSSFENLISQIAFYDYAILIATGDDITISRKKRGKVTRDNVLFEFGLFSGGLGRDKVFYVLEQGTKLPTDLLGITLPSIPVPSDPTYEEKVEQVGLEIKRDIINKEKTFHLGFLPSTALAYGYFTNFVERVTERLQEDKANGKEFVKADGSTFKIINLRFTILLPTDLSENMFNKVKAKRLNSNWQKMKVDPKDVRDYDFSIDVSHTISNEIHVIDVPLTLNALNKCIDMYANKQHMGKNTKEQLLEHREIRNFRRTLQYLIDSSSFTRGLVTVEIVDI